MAEVEVEIRSRCMELSPFGATVFSAVAASRVAPVVQIYLRGVEKEDDYFGIDAGIRSVWRGISGRPVSSTQLTTPTKRVESLAADLEYAGSEPAVRCSEALEVIGSALACHREPAARFAADASSSAFDLVYNWLELEIEEAGNESPTLDQDIRRDPRFADEVSRQDTLLRSAAEFGDGPLDKRVASSLQNDAEEWSMRYMNWMTDLVRSS